ncbi:hypothetical protein MRB53_034174 [Persea americana]|uniref:Uncharacterized protein n=1 Tax=Persea americana TaxID=3435 RepID=A0ACC2KWR0_PERAE|nr:hypothetical protein MRB53_034174 [Persea americana]
MLLRGGGAVGRAIAAMESERENPGRCLGQDVFFSRQEPKHSKGFSGLRNFWQALGTTQPPAGPPARIGLSLGLQS